MPWKMKLAKAFLVVYNCIFVLLGAVLLAGGIWMHFDLENVLASIRLEQSQMTGAFLQTTSLVIIGLGVLILMLAFLGCCGACCESVCLLALYTGCLFVILLAEIVCAILFAVYKTEMTMSLGTTMFQQVHFQYNRTSQNNTHDVTYTWDVMQIKFQCCGAKSPKDYYLSRWYNETRAQGNPPHVPASCCVLTNDDQRYPQAYDLNQCQLDALLFPNLQESSALHTKGCLVALADTVKSSSVVVIVVATIIAILQVIGLIFGCCLMADVRRSQNIEDRGDYRMVEKM